MKQKTDKHFETICTKKQINFILDVNFKITKSKKKK